jgi:hypothetical protein
MGFGERPEALANTDYYFRAGTIRLLKENLASYDETQVQKWDQK